MHFVFKILIINQIHQNCEEKGPVVQFGMNAAFARRRSRVQIPPGPPILGFESNGGAGEVHVFIGR